MEHYLFVLYLALPALFGNAIPIVTKKLNWFKALNTPIDFYKTFRGKRISGNNKTIRGFISASLVGLLVGLLQYFLDQQNIILIPFFNSFYQFISFGFLAGLSALLGDLIESFVKRQLNIKPGHPFIPFDQIDHLLGFILFTYPMIHWNWNEILFILSFGIISPITNIISYKLKIKDTYW